VVIRETESRVVGMSTLSAAATGLALELTWRWADTRV